MEKFNKLISLLLIFTLLLPSVNSYAVIDASSDEEVSKPENPPGTPPGVQCTEIDVKPGASGVCCVGLEPNSAGICDEPVLNDTALVTCTSDASCSEGTGCFPQAAKDLFSTASPNTADKDELSEAQGALNAQLSEVETFKENGRTCAHSRECSSYSCVSGICMEKNVCRFAKEGEIASNDIKCAGDLVKGAGGKCELSADAKNQVYIGLLKEATLLKDMKNQCRFEIEEETRLRSLIAMKSLRAMEWFFSTIDLNTSEDCFQIVPTLKTEIGSTFLTTRKTILSNFNDVLTGIEKDYKTLIASKTADPKATVVIHNNESITNEDLYSRQTSGVDNLMMLYRRNILFQNYEQAMLKTVDAANTRLTSLNTAMGTWSGGASSWSLGNRNVSGFNCDGSKYKVKKFLSWKTKYYNEIRDRWANYYEVSGNADLNADIVKREEVSKTLGLMGGLKPEEAVAEFTKSKFYLIDPLMFSGMKNGNYGQSKPLKKKSSFLGLFGGFKDLRHAYYLKGDAAGSFTKMHADVRPALENFYKGLNESNKTSFVYEPELLTTEAKDCFDPKNANAAGCAGFKPFLDSVHDEAFGHFLAYAHSNRDSYEGYFENATSYRRRLLAKLQVDMQNISKYYQKVIETRELQNNCITEVAKGLSSAGILVDGPESDKGVIEGPSSSTLAANPVSGLPAGTKSTEIKGSKIPKFIKSDFSYDLTSNSIKDLTSKGLKADLGTSGSIGASGSLTSTTASNMAFRSDAMTNANKRAKSKGVNLENKEKAVTGIVNSMKNSAFGGGSGAMVGSSIGAGARFGSGNIGSATVGKEFVKSSDVDSSEVNKVSEKNVTTVTSSSGLAGIEAGANSSAAASSSDGSDKDHSGLSDSEKERLMSAYEKNKTEYEGAEDDGIFSKVSKAYVRNLDKVLTKKKKIQD